MKAKTKKRLKTAGKIIGGIAAVGAAAYGVHKANEAHTAYSQKKNANDFRQFTIAGMNKRSEADMRAQYSANNRANTHKAVMKGIPAQHQKHVLHSSQKRSQHKSHSHMVGSGEIQRGAKVHMIKRASGYADFKSNKPLG